MPLFETTDSKTPAQKIAEQLLKSAENQAMQIARSYLINYNRLWNSPGVDPKDILAALGANALPLFVVTNQTMAIAAPDQLKTIPPQYTWSADAQGNITLTDVPLASSSSSSPADFGL